MDWYYKIIDAMRRGVNTLQQEQVALVLLYGALTIVAIVLMIYAIANLAKK